ncbi:MAG TPA: hypothetical protein VF407_14705 [Polyangiaceae bacterium]
MKAGVAARSSSLLTLLVIGCSSSSPVATDAGAGADASEPSVRLCIEPQDIEGGGEFPSVGQLPSGSCTEGDTCSQSVTPCCDLVKHGEVDGEICTCASGTWHCEVRYQGGGLCSPGKSYPNCSDDAGSDTD